MCQVERYVANHHTESGRRSQCLKQQLLTMGGYFFKGAGIIGPFENPVAPQKSSHGGQSVGEGNVLFARPVDDESAFALGVYRRINDHDDGIQAEEKRSLAKHRVLDSATRGAQEQVGLGFLIRGFLTPTFGVTLDNIGWGHLDVSGEKVFVAMRAVQIPDVYPSNGDESVALFVPVSDARDHRDMAFFTAIPIHGESHTPSHAFNAFGGGGQFLSLYSWSSLALVGRGEFMKLGIGVEATDKNESTTTLTASSKTGKSMCSERPIPAELEFAVGKPMQHRREQCFHDLGWSAMLSLVGLIPVGCSVQRNENGKCPRTLRKGELHDDTQGDPFMSVNPRSEGMRRAYSIAMTSFTEDGFSRMSGGGVIADKMNHSTGNKALDNKGQKLSGKLPAIPFAVRKNVMVRGWMSRQKCLNRPYEIAHGTRTDGKYRRQTQRYHALESWLAEAACEDLKDRSDVLRYERHASLQGSTVRQDGGSRFNRHATTGGFALFGDYLALFHAAEAA
jgi:hypothetical protein